jgi:hypothetical protein
MEAHERKEFKGNLFEPTYNDTNHKCSYDIFRFFLAYNPVRTPNYELSSCSYPKLKSPQIKDFFSQYFCFLLF